MRLIKDGRTVTVEHEAHIAAYKAKGWVEVAIEGDEPEVEAETEPEVEAEKPKRGRKPKAD